MIQSVLRDLILRLYNSSSPSGGLGVDSRAMLVGAKRSINWMNLGMSKEEFVVSLGINALAMMGTEYILNSESEYFKLTLGIATFALSVLVTPTINRVFHYGISYSSALKIAALNLSLRISYWFFKQSFLQIDKEKLIEPIKTDPNTTQSTSNQLIDDKKMMREMILFQRDPDLIKFASPKLLSDREFISEMIHEFPNERFLKKASAELRNDKELVLDAVKLNENAFADASEKLQSNREFVLEVIKHSSSAFAFASSELRNDRDVVHDAIKLNKNVLRYASPNFQKEIIRDNFGYFMYASSEVRNDKELSIEAVKHNLSALWYVSAEVRKDLGFISEVNQINRLAGWVLSNSPW